MQRGTIIPGRYFRDELEKDGLNLQDAVRVLKTGNIFHEPEPDTKTGDWKYRVEAPKWTAMASNSPPTGSRLFPLLNWCLASAYKGVDRLLLAGAHSQGQNSCL